MRCRHRHRMVAVDLQEFRTLRMNIEGRFSWEAARSVLQAAEASLMKVAPLYRQRCKGPIIYLISPSRAPISSSFVTESKKGICKTSFAPPTVIFVLAIAVHTYISGPILFVTAVALRNLCEKNHQFMSISAIQSTRPPNYSSGQQNPTTSSKNPHSQAVLNEQRPA